MDSHSDGSTSVVCPIGYLTVKKPLPLNEVVLTAVMPTGMIITDIAAILLPGCSKTASASDFGQTGCSVDLGIGYTAIAFDCTGGSNEQSITLPFPTNVIGKEHAFLSVVVSVSDVCDTPLMVNTFTIEGTRVPHATRGCPPPTPLSVGCNQPIPRYARIRIPIGCHNPI